MQSTLFRPRLPVLARPLGPALLFSPSSSSSLCARRVVQLFQLVRRALPGLHGGRQLREPGPRQPVLGHVREQPLLIAFCLVGQIGLGFLVALLACGRMLKLREFHRTAIFFPVVISAVVIGFMWSMIYNKDYGLLNYVLRGLGLSGMDQAVPRRSPHRDVLRVHPGGVAVYRAVHGAVPHRLQGIEPAIFEVAEIDGASALQRAVHITLPLLVDTMKVAVMLCIAGNMKIFDHIFIMTGGGPGRARWSWRCTRTTRPSRCSSWAIPAPYPWGSWSSAWRSSSSAGARCARGPHENRSGPSRVHGCAGQRHRRRLFHCMPLPRWSGWRTPP